ncbi:STAS domain-containing protein [Saccharothrix sp. S26]|uniref:STAS domain-containing protein n=1 Tax=Saccharothrix sp. S26 TaxID=2907215 RepID=UPI001F254B43|nr:STAS domain-containing protein [Saccharothrix sp. S26]MCE6998337.1 STAS domain-containing protein [Saccharothrix sp. S26]
MNAPDAPTFGLTSNSYGDATVVSVTGDIDMSNSDALSERCLELIDAGVGALVLDLSGVTFFASSGIAALGRIRVHNAANRGRPVHVVASRSVRRSLEVTAMDRLLPLHQTLDDALKAAADGQ